MRHATPGATAELVLNGTPVGTAKADAEGIATVTAKPGLDAPIDASVWVEACGDARRVILARLGVQPPPDPVCTRTQIAGVFLVQRVTSIVIDLRGLSLLLRQGRAPDAWLEDPVSAGDADAAPPRPPLPPLTGLMLFGGLGRGWPANFSSQFCGSVTSCSDSASTPFTGGAAWWFTDFLAAEGRYSYLGTNEAEGSDNTFRFTTTREGEVLAVSARGGVRAGRVRPFGRAGMSFHRATVTTTQTVNDTTVTIDGVTQTVPGGTQVIQMRTSGWAPVFGGGAEVWLSRLVGIYGEVERIALKGEDDRGSGLEIDDAVITLQVGVTVRFR